MSSLFSRRPLDIGPFYSYVTHRLAHKGRRRVTPAERGECGSRGRGCHPCSRAAPGQNARPARRPACGLITPAALGRPGVGNTRPSVVPSQEVRELELSGGVRSLPQVPRWNAGRRARPKRKGGASRLLRGAPRAPLRAGITVCVCRRSASFILFVRHCEEPTGPARRGRPDDRLRDEVIQLLSAALDCFAELVIGTRDFARSRWLAKTVRNIAVRHHSRAEMGCENGAVLRFFRHPEVET